MIVLNNETPLRTVWFGRPPRCSFLTPATTSEVVRGPENGAGESTRRADGCYGWQVDGEDFTETIIVKVVGRLRGR